MSRRFLALALTTAAATAWHGSALAEPFNNLTDLGYIEVDSYGDTYSAAIDVNEHGVVAGISTQGQSDVHGTEHYYGFVTDLGTLGGPDRESEARAINDAGQIAGWSDQSSGGTRAFRWESGTMSNLGVLTGGFYSEAYDINELGDVVGYSDTSTNYRAFMYSGGVLRDLGSLIGGDGSLAYAVNDAGQATGYADYGTDSHAFLYDWDTNVMTDLGTLGGTRSYGRNLNEAGDVIGEANIVGDTAYHPFVYRDGVMKDLGILPGGIYASADRISPSGLVIGGASATMSFPHNDHPVLWINDVIKDLGDMGDTNGRITGVHDNGDAIGYQYDASMNSTCFLYDAATDSKKVLGTLGGNRCETADWTESGLIVGTSKTSTGDDHAFITKCRPLPAKNCDTAGKMQLQIKDSDDDSKDQLKWKWSGGSAVAQADVGNPATADRYRLCIYDSTGDVDNLVTALEIAPNGAWVNSDPKGYGYKDSEGAKDGVTKIQIKTGADGKSKAQLAAKGAAIPMPTRFSSTQYFQSGSGVTVQLARTGGTQCWTSQFDVATTNDGTTYKAKTQE
jgi:probable HAF family extracellular repeat protein